ncbi:hypothetical protein OHA46_34125 (plasmid) [Streptomyces sp. NBC_00708]|uniref:hypothetical protein n=1 Tax=Streptomyces sp. NBC_01789 TaxID=2975941 RepID=UPI002252A690|nr:hypothetical protein [Streptomyces sp. NBC_01789]MCX4451735.1 hypothetical protein [Streptomyces sp. NBC_01789]
MATLLMGRWDTSGNLLIEAAVNVEDGDDATMDGYVDDQDDSDCMAWAASFDVDDHSRAVQRAYEEYVRDDGTELIDKVHGFEPNTD